MKNIVIILSEVNSATSIASLASLTAVSIASSHGTGLLADFLMKKIRFQYFLKGAVADETIIMGIARGDATVTEIKAALEQVQLERDLTDQANKRRVLFETLKVMTGVAANPGGHEVNEMEASVGGGKGIPFEKGDGWQIFAYNPDNGALSAGAQELGGQVTYYGIWL